MQACCPYARFQYSIITLPLLVTGVHSGGGSALIALLLHRMLAAGAMAPVPAASTDQHPATCHCSTDQQVAQLDSEQVRSAAQRVLSGSKRGSKRLVADYQVQQVTLSAMHCFDLETTQVDF